MTEFHVELYARIISIFQMIDLCIELHARMFCSSSDTYVCRMTFIKDFLFPMIILHVE